MGLNFYRIIFVFIFYFWGFNLIIPCFLSADNQIFSKICAQVNNIKNRSKDNQNDRNINKNYSTPSNGGGGGNSYRTPAPNNNYNKNNNNNNWYSKPSTGGSKQKSYGSADSSYSDPAMGCSDLDVCCIPFAGIANAVLGHQNFLVQSKVVNPRILSMELYAIGAFPAYYSSSGDSTASGKNEYFPGSFLSIPKVRLNWGMFSTEFRYSNLYEFKVGRYETYDWQILMLNLFSRREFYLTVGTGFMYEKANDTYFNEHSLSTYVAFGGKLSGNFDFRFSHDTQTQIFPRVEAGLRFNYNLAQTNHADFDLTFGVLHQNYYQSVRLYYLSAGLVVLIH